MGQVSFNQLNSLLTHRITRWGLGVLIGAALLMEAVFLLGSVAKVASPKDVLLARDDDAAVFLDATRDTTWLNDVDAPYGPLYYRIAATVQKVVPDALFASTDRPTEREVSQSYHFALMVTSALALLVLAFIIALGAGNGWPERLAVASGVVLIVFHFHVWTHHIFRGHPELLLTALVAGATFCSLGINRFGSRLRSRRFYLAAIIWGLACATKQSAGGFVLGYGLLLLLPASKAHRLFNPRRFVEALIAALLVLATYFVVGAPRTLHLFSNIANASRFVAEKSDGFSVEWSLHWLQNLGVHLLPLLLLVLAAGFLFHPFRNTDERPGSLGASSLGRLGDSGWVLLIPAVPLLLILRTKLVIPTEHYMLTIIAATVVAQTFVQAPRVNRLFRRAPRAIGMMQPALAAVMIVGTAVVVLASGGRHKNAVWSVERQAKCIPAVEAIIQQIIEHRRSKRDLLAATPYFPCPMGQRCRQMWGMTDDRLKRFKPRFLGISHAYAKRFINDVSDYDKHLRKNWRKVQSFHRRFHKQTDVVDHHGIRWKRLYKTQTCGFELWERTSPAKQKRSK